MMAFFAGCGRPAVLPIAGDSTSAQAAVTAALNHWHTGRSPEELKTSNPKLLFRDEDWRDGSKLLEFDLSEEPQPNGTSWRVFATLTLEKNGKPLAPQKVCYDVALGDGSMASVSRSDFLH